MLWLLLALTLLGLALLTLGLRGRVVGDAPHCRACTFDLSGLDLTPADAVCPECAAGLASPAAVRSGLRVRSRRVWVTGLMLVLLPALIAVPITTGRWTTWNTHKPVWVLGLDTDLGSDPIMAAALAELRRRDLLGELEPDGKRVLLHALAAQFEYATTLDLGDLTQLQAAHESGELSDQRWNNAIAGIDRFAQSYVDTFAVPDRWGLVLNESGELNGDPLWPTRTSFDGPAGGLGVLVLIDLDEVRIDGKPVNPASPGNTESRDKPWYQAPTHIAVYKGGSGYSTMAFDGRPTPEFVSARNPLRSLPPGEYDLTTTWTLRPYVDGSAGRHFSRGVLKTATPLTPRTNTGTTHVVIARHSPDLIEPVTDAEGLEQARAYFSLSSVGENVWGRRSGDPPSLVALSTNFSWAGSSGAEITLVGHLELEWGGVRIRPEATAAAGSTAPPIARQALSSGDGGFGRALRVVPPTPRPKAVTVIFVPDLAAAPDYAGPWRAERGTPMPTVASEIRWENIPIEWLATPEDNPIPSQSDGP